MSEEIVDNKKVIWVNSRKRHPENFQGKIGVSKESNF